MKEDLHSEDMFADTRMTFGEHIEDLRTHMIRAILGFLVALCLSFFIGKPVLRFIAAPVDRELMKYYEQRALRVAKQLAQTDEYKEANRPKFMRLSFNRAQFEAAIKGKDPAEVFGPLPEAMEGLPHGQLTTWSQYEVGLATEAFYDARWKDLGERAADLKRLGQALPTAASVPDAKQETLDDNARQQEQEATKLQKAADAEDTEDVEASLNRLTELLGSQGLVQMWVRIEDPVKFFAMNYKAQAPVTKRPGLSTLSVQEAFMAYFKVCLACGVVIGSPWIFWQMWLFVAAGLYPHEKRLVNVYLPVSLALFLVGVMMCEFIVLPKAIEALLWFNQWVGLEPDLRFNEWLGFAIMMPLVFGISFQLPLVMMFLEKIGVMTVQGYLNYWKISFFLIHVFAAVITPSVDIVSMECLALPMFGLYLLGIVLCRFNRRERELDIDVPDSGELVEV